MVPLLPIIEQYAEKATIAIDIGTCKGTGSTRYIRKGMEKNPAKNKVFISIDIKDERQTFYDFEQHPWEHYILGDSREQSTVEKVKKIIGDRPADLIMIDTIHEYDFLKQELKMWQEFADKNTVWLFHDTWMFGAYNHMTDAIKEFAAESGIWEYVDITQETHGLGMLRPK
jgi:cephalosporin hydroxylase